MKRKKIRTVLSVLVTSVVLSMPSSVPVMAETTGEMPVTFTVGAADSGDKTDNTGTDKDKTGTAHKNTAVASSNGSASVSPENAKAGDKVTVTLSAKTGYEVADIIVTDGTGKKIPVTKNSGGTYSYTMPDSGVTVTPVFKKTGSSAADMHTTTEAASDNGTVTIDKPAAKAGETVTVTPNQKTGYEISDIIVTDADGNKVPVTKNADGTYSYTAPDADVTITPIYKKTGSATAETHSVTITASDNGSVTASTTSPKAGDTVTLTAKANADYEVSSITVKDTKGNTIPAAKNTDGTYAFTAPDADVTVIPAFKKTGSTAAETHTLTASSVENGTVTADKTTAAAGDTVTVTPKPADGYTTESVVFTDSKGNVIPAKLNDNGTYTLTMPDSDVTVTPKFVADTEHKNTAAKADNGSVTISPTSAKKGAKITVTVKPDTGYQLKSLSAADADGNIIETTKASDGTYSYVMPYADVTVTASFEASSQTEYKISVASSDNGSIALSQTTGKRGDTVTVTAVPATGYKLKELSAVEKNSLGVGLVKKSDTKYIFTMPESDVTITAKFEKTDAADDTKTDSTSSSSDKKAATVYKIMMDTGEHGKVTADPASGAEGTKVTVTVKPDDGYAVDYIFVTDKDNNSFVLNMVNQTTYTFVMPASDVTVKTVFKKQGTSGTGTTDTTVNTNGTNTTSGTNSTNTDGVSGSGKVDSGAKTSDALGWIPDLCLAAFAAGVLIIMSDHRYRKQQAGRNRKS